MAVALIESSWGGRVGARGAEDHDPLSAKAVTRSGLVSLGAWPTSVNDRLTVQPTYILDIPGGNGKVPIGPIYAHEDHGRWSVRNHLDQLFDLPEDVYYSRRLGEHHTKPTAVASCPLKCDGRCEPPIRRANQ